MLPAQIIFGYHGCDESVLRLVLDGGELKPSGNAYDWLGHVIYFWERSPIRALKWAQEMARTPHSTITNPGVVRAVINLGDCLDLADPESAELVRFGYNDYLHKCKTGKITPPRNKGPRIQGTIPRLRRDEPPPQVA